MCHLHLKFCQDHFCTFCSVFNFLLLLKDFLKELFILQETMYVFLKHPWRPLSAPFPLLICCLPKVPIFVFSWYLQQPSCLHWAVPTDFSKQTSAEHVQYSFHPNVYLDVFWGVRWTQVKKHLFLRKRFTVSNICILIYSCDIGNVFYFSNPSLLSYPVSCLLLPEKGALIRC